MEEKNKNTRRRGSALFFLLVIYLVTPALTTRLSPNKYQGGYSKDLRLRSLRNRSAAAVILGELRSSMSDLMFIKTERYMHSGVAYQLNIDYEALSSKGQLKDVKHKQETEWEGEHTHEHAHKEEAEGRKDQKHEHPPAPEHEHKHIHPPRHDQSHFQCQGADTVIRTPDRDFRGFIGDLHRKVKPWLDPSKPHLHTDGTELLPWYRLMTLSDPHNVRAYMIGAWWLKRQNTEDQLREAMDFVKEGIQHNPEAYQLYLMLGHIYRKKQENRKASRAYRKAAEIAIKVRPKEGEKHPDWTYYDEEDALASIRLAVMTEYEFGDKKKAPELARRYLKAIGGNDAVLERQIRKWTSDHPNS